jgi:hypothetical protein
MMREPTSEKKIVDREEISVFVTTTAFSRYFWRASLVLISAGEVVSPWAQLMINRGGLKTFMISSGVVGKILPSGDCRKSPCCTSAYALGASYPRTSERRFAHRSVALVESLQSKRVEQLLGQPEQVSVPRFPQNALFLQPSSTCSTRVGDGSEQPLRKHLGPKSRELYRLFLTRLSLLRPRAGLAQP